MIEPTEAQIRLGVFIGLFVLMAVLELVMPRRRPKNVKARRWLTNWSIVILDSILVRLLFTGGAVAGAIWAQGKGIGLFNWVSTSQWLAIIASVIILDFAVWLSHLASHKIPIFWRVHRMHHSDIDFDVTTAIRFHPIEIILSMVWKFGVVLLLGAPAFSVLLFEIILNGTALFNHSNFKMPLALDRIVRLFVVTPDMHRVHHSIVHNETDSNYGFNLSVWDRIFGTYVDQPEAGHDDMIIGLEPWQDEQPSRLSWSLKVPFMKQ